MTGEAGDALSLIPGLAQARPHSHSEDKLVVTAFDSGMERITAAGAYLKREVLAVWPTSDKCFGYKNQIIRAHRGAGDSALARRHASYSNPIVGRFERRSQVRAGCRIRSGAVATPEVRSEKRLGRERPGRFAHKPTKPEAQFRRSRNKTHSCDISTSRQRGSAG